MNTGNFDYEIYYSEVYHQKGGFDVVIANPPYVRQEAIKEIKPTLKKQFGDFYCGTADLYTYFYKRGLEILKPSGHLCFIAPNKFMRAGYGKNTRRLLAGEATPKVVIERPDVLALMEKLRKVGTPLGEYVHGRFYRGVLTGLNEAFVIDESTRQRLIAEDSKSADLIKPWLRGRDIKKWKAEWAGLYVIFTRRGVDIDRYPAIKKHLAQYRKDLAPKKSEKDKHGRKPGPYEWYEIQDNIAYYHEFEKPKIIYPNITKSNIFSYDESSIYTNQKCFIIPTEDKYLLAVLNSAITMYWVKRTLPLLQGSFYEPSSIFMKDFPVFVASEAKKAAITLRVQTILSAPDAPGVPALEKEIDGLVYQLYGLTPDEIALIEGRK